MDDVSAELVQAAIDGDERFALINLGIQVENEINTSESLKIIFKESFDEATQALMALAFDVKAEDTVLIREKQNIVIRARDLRKWLLERVARGARTEQTIHDDAADLASQDANEN